MDNTFAFYSTNPSSPSFYYIVILSYIVISGLISSINYYFKKKAKESNPDSFSVNRSLQLNREQKILKFKFLAAYVLTRASTWAKGPYLFTLYHKYHGFTIDEIGILYIIDAIFAFLSGPIFGSFADRYGRRLFSSFYCLFVVSNLVLRITGIRSLAYIAQILTGLGSTLLTTPFESWIVYEASKLIQETPNDKERYLQGIFKDQALFDALCSIIVSAITAVIYTVYGIIAPLLFAILMATIAYFVIILTWDENKPNSINEKSNYDSFLDACCELKKRNVLSIGIIESLWMATLNLYIFIWTPVLENSTDDGKMNIGFIFFVFVLMAINGILLFELIVIHLKCRYYIAYFISLLFELISFLFVYRVDSFIVRLIMFSFINVRIIIYINH